MGWGFARPPPGEAPTHESLPPPLDHRSPKNFSELFLFEIVPPLVVWKSWKNRNLCYSQRPVFTEKGSKFGTGFGGFSVVASSDSNPDFLVTHLAPARCVTKTSGFESDDTAT